MAKLSKRVRRQNIGIKSRRSILRFGAGQAGARGLGDVFVDVDPRVDIRDYLETLTGRGGLESLSLHSFGALMEQLGAAAARGSSVVAPPGAGGGGRELPFAGSGFDGWGFAKGLAKWTGSMWGAHKAVGAGAGFVGVPLGTLGALDGLDQMVRAQDGTLTTHPTHPGQHHDATGPLPEDSNSLAYKAQIEADNATADAAAAAGDAAVAEAEAQVAEEAADVAEREYLNNPTEENAQASRKAIDDAYAKRRTAQAAHDNADRKRSEAQEKRAAADAAKKKAADEKKEAETGADAPMNPLDMRFQGPRISERARRRYGILTQREIEDRLTDASGQRQDLISAVSQRSRRRRESRPSGVERSARSGTGELPHGVGALVRIGGLVNPSGTTPQSPTDHVRYGSLAEKLAGIQTVNSYVIKTDPEDEGDGGSGQGFPLPRGVS